MKITRRGPAYRISLWALLFVSLFVLWRLNTRILSNPIYIPVDDFGQYWGAGRLILSGQNPYDAVKIQELKNQITGQPVSPETIPIMWTPPWSLPVVMLFGWLDYPLSRMIWLLANVTVILAASSSIWKFYSGPSKLTWPAWIISFTFAPTISVLEKGQITPLLLAGIAGFMLFLERKHNAWMAGIFAALISFKPQLFFLFWIALVLWVFYQKQWIVLVAVGLTILVGTLFPVLFNPRLIHQYIQAFLNNAPTGWATPTLGSYLRLIFGIEKTWLQFAPMLVGCIWIVFYFFQHKKQWVWSKQMPLLILVSFVFSGYSWTYDQVLSLIAVIPSFIRIIQHPQKLESVWMLTVYILLMLSDLVLHRWLDEFWFGWLAPALLIWYLLARKWYTPASSPEAA